MYYDLMTTTQDLQPLHAAVKAKAIETGVRLILGYIGNCGVDRRGSFDDRAWMIWLPTYHLCGQHNDPSIGHHKTAELDSLLALLNDGAVERRVAKLESDPKMYRKPAKSWDGKEIGELDGLYPKDVA